MLKWCTVRASMRSSSRGQRNTYTKRSDEVVLTRRTGHEKRLSSHVARGGCMVVRFTWPKFGFGTPVGLPVPRHEPHLLLTVE